MESTEFSTRLFQAEPDSPELASLARELVNDARYPAHHAISRYLSSAEEDDRIKAKNILDDLAELALVPLTEIPPGGNLEIELWDIRSMTDTMIAMRLRAASALRDLLASRKPVLVAPESAPAPGFPAGTRICDLAYISLQRILHIESSPSAFLGHAAPERDRQIESFKTSREFKNAFPSKS